MDECSFGVGFFGTPNDGDGVLEMKIVKRREFAVLRLCLTIEGVAVRSNLMWFECVQAGLVMGL